ncbi:MAG: 50S ribosomal protein L21 [Candidatus Peregrinibacteria bacterium]|nr:50S ribosomal protein L21 [Candidatus Peregrinibacteria bacterium]
MFAIVDIGGFQERVSEGLKLKVPLMEGDAGKKLQFGNVLLVVDGETVSLGLPFLQGASVEAKVLGHGRGEKIRVVKAHKRKRYKRVHGHKQHFTEIEITKIAV